MKLLCKMGRYAGEVVEYSPRVARELLKSGRAVKVSGQERSFEKAVIPKARR